MKYIIDHSGIALESEYPYLAADGPKCDHRAAHHKVRPPCAVIHVDDQVQDMLWVAVSDAMVSAIIPDNTPDAEARVLWVVARPLGADPSMKCRCRW